MHYFRYGPITSAFHFESHEDSSSSKSVTEEKVCDRRMDLS